MKNRQETIFIRESESLLLAMSVHTGHCNVEQIKVLQYISHDTVIMMQKLEKT